MLTKCIEKLYGETTPSYSYYLSDSSEINITGGITEFLTIDDSGASGKHGQLKAWKLPEDLQWKHITTVLSWRLDCMVSLVYKIWW